jgi:hypothetical protein
MSERAATGSKTVSGRIARGSDGGGLVRRAYRRSPIRYLRKRVWDHRGIRPNDVFLTAYPRSGSVWMRFLLTDALVGDADFPLVHATVPYVGRHHDVPEVVPGGGRVIKTHEPYMSRYRRAIHLVRDPRDVVISYFHFLQRIEKIVVDPTDDVEASFDHHVDAFLAGRVDGFGTWQYNLDTWLEAPERGADVIRVRYEDLKADPATEIRRLTDWLGCDLTDADIARVIENCSVERMQASESEARANDPRFFNRHAMRTGLPVVREGRAGGWRTNLTADQQRRFSVFASGLSALGYPAPAEG